MSTRLDTDLNILNKENQYARKCKKSTIDILSAANNQKIEDGAMELIMFDFSKAFGNIERGILWAKLYKAGLPRNFAQTLKMGHGGKKL